eukprot:756637-Hanusia_phi.AAC.1
MSDVESHTTTPSAADETHQLGHKGLIASWLTCCETQEGWVVEKGRVEILSQDEVGVMCLLDVVVHSVLCGVEIEGVGVQAGSRRDRSRRKAWG